MRGILIGTGPGHEEAPLDGDLVVGINGSARLPGVAVAAFFDLLWSEVHPGIREVWTAPARVEEALRRFPDLRIEPLGTVEAALRCPRIGGNPVTMLGAIVTAAKRGADEIHVYGAPMHGGPNPDRWSLERQRFAHVAVYVGRAYGATVWRHPAGAAVVL